MTPAEVMADSPVYQEAVQRFTDAQVKAMECVKAAQVAIAELRDRGIATMDQQAHDMITAMRWRIKELEDGKDEAIRAAVAQERERCAKIVGSYQVPVGNSPAGEMACEWTMDALREIAAAIRRGE